MKILIFGANGFLGKKLSTHFSEKHQVLRTATTKSPGIDSAVDIRNKEAVDCVFEEFKPDVAINCAAICNLKKCEDDESTAYEVHVEGTKNIAEACKRHAALLIYISTDYIFNGKSGPYEETSQPHPLGKYGLTKLQGEQALQETGARFLIIRPTILYGYNGPKDKSTFVIDILDKLENNQEIKADNERIKYPILLDDFARCIDHLISVKAKGIFNLATEKGYTRFEWAKLIAEVFDHDPSRISPKNAEEYNKGRPKDVKLIIKKLIATGFEPLDLKKGLEMMKNQIRR